MKNIKMKNPKWTLIVTIYLMILFINPHDANGFIVPSQSPSSFHKHHTTTTITTTTTKATTKDQNDIPRNQPSWRQIMIQTSTIILIYQHLHKNPMLSLKIYPPNLIHKAPNSNLSHSSP